MGPRGRNDGRGRSPPHMRSKPLPVLARALVAVGALVALVAGSAGPAGAEDPTAEITAASLPQRSISAAAGSFLSPVEGTVHFTDAFGAPRSGARQHKGNDLLGHKLQKLLAAR